MTNPRDLIQRLADDFDYWLKHRSLFDSDADDLIAEARAYLAQPEPSPPTRKELLETYRAGYFDGKSREGPEAHESGLRAVLARYCPSPTRETH